MVIWTCLTHTGHPEWEGPTTVFELIQDRDAPGLLRFRHIGLNSNLSCYQTCQTGWEHILASPLRYAGAARGSRSLAEQRASRSASDGPSRSDRASRTSGSEWIGARGVRTGG
jgi:hypothetical protein